MTKFEDVKTQTTEEYFKNNKFSIDAFKKKYALYEGETYVQALKRVCDFIASAEPTENLKKYWSERWFDEIYNDWWHPAGSIMQGAGSGRKISTANCTHNSLGVLHNEEEWDNLESIIKNTAYTVAKCAAYRQGLGVDFSRLRPSGTKVLNSSNESTGAVHWMKFIDTIGYYVGQKGRIPAMLFSLSIKHPDVERFITIKSDYTQIQNANISVQCTDDFYDAVEKDLEWELKFEIPEVKKGDRVYIDVHSVDMDCKYDESISKYYKIASHDRPYEVFTKKVNARKLLELIAKNMHANAEPGIQNIDMARRYSNSDAMYDPNDVYDSRIVGTNAPLVGHTLIPTPNGIFPIEKLYNKGESLVISDTIVTIPSELINKNGNCKFATKTIPVLAKFKKYENQRIWKLTLSNGQEFECNGEHKWLINGEMVPTRNIKVGDKLFKSNGGIVQACDYNIDFKSSDFKLGDEASVNFIEEYQNENSNCVIPTKCYVNKDFCAGFLRRMYQLNGSVKSKGNSTQLIYTSYSKYIVSEIRDLLANWFGIHTTLKSSADKLKYELTINLPEHVFRFKQYIGLTGKLGRQLKQIEQPHKKNNKIISLSVTSVIETNEYDTMYCAEIKELHAFVVNGCMSSNCSEQYLSRDSLCVLASINCGNFSTNPKEYVFELEKIGLSINRFLDNVNECELLNKTYATPHQRLAIEKLRRTGAGVTNIAAWLFKQKLVYGDQNANDAFEEFMKLYNYWMYVGTEELGKEKGNFGLFNSKKWKSAPFISRLLKESKNISKKYNTPVLTGNYARNVTCSSIAPTGTLTLMFRDTAFSYGIEPAFFLYYWKRTRMAGKYEYYFNVPKVVRDTFEEAGFKIPMESDTIKDDWDGKYGKVIAEFIDKHKNDVGIKFKTSTQISALDKLKFMSQVMKWIDSSISVTYMLPENSTWKDVYDFIIHSHKLGVKSIAAFPDKKMYGIVSEIAFKDLALNLQSQGVSIHHQNFDDEELKTMNISRENITQLTGKYPKRLSTLDADIYTVTVKGEKYCVVVGLQNNRPYEIFGGHLNGLGLKSNYKRGKIIKVKKSQYALEFDDIYIEDFSKQFTPTEQILFRMASMSLRHGVPIQFVVEQLQKAQNDITSMAAAAARCLKKYIKDGTTLTGQKCPQCSKESLIYTEGCCTCSSCGWSKCS